MFVTFRLKYRLCGNDYFGMKKSVFALLSRLDLEQIFINPNSSLIKF